LILELKENRKLGEQMIVATIKMRVDPKQRRELVQTFDSLYQPILKEPGCLGCSFYAEIGDDNTVMVIEEWESETHWKDHLQSKDFAVLLGAMSLFDSTAGKFQLLSETEGVTALRTLRARDHKRLSNG